MELGQISLSNCFMKGTRLARLLGDSDMLQIFQWELSGYPSPPNGITADVWSAAKRANRILEKKDKKSGDISEHCYVQSIEVLETEKTTAETRLSLTELKSVSISSANPSQFVHAPAANIPERNVAQATISKTASKIAARRAFLYEYVLSRHMELRVSSPAESIFSEYRQRVDDLMGQFIPQELVKIDSISDNLNSKNAEDWANAAHTCRRLLQALADNIYPARKDEKRGTGKSAKTIKLGEGNYINRLVCYCEEQNSSGIFNGLLGSHLSFIGNRLDAIFPGTQKGSHEDVDLDEARRIVILTYICAGDILKVASASQEVVANAEVAPA